ncbi:MAG: NAD-dependent epimerase/dehydratase family protein [Dokdonella sp.]
MSVATSVRADGDTRSVALVFGATGQVGRFLLPLLQRANYRIVAISRADQSPDSGSSGIEWLRGDLHATMPEYLPQANVIFSLGPLDAFARWLNQANLEGAPHIVAFSSMSADSKIDSPDPDERAISARLRAAERDIAEIASKRGGRWTILRPTLIYGTGQDHSFTPIVRFAMTWHVFPIPLAANGLRQPVHSQDLANACMACLNNPNSHAQIYSLGGGERLSARAMFQRIRRSLSHRTIAVPLPVFLLRAAMRMLRRISGWRHLRVAMLDRLDVDLIADNSAAGADLGWRPRSFCPETTC